MIKSSSKRVSSLQVTPFYESVYPQEEFSPRLLQTPRQLKVVLDTNVYISAMVFGGIPRKIIQLGIERRILMVTSTAILLEVAGKLHEKFMWNEEKVKVAIKAISEIAGVVRPTITLDIVKKDLDDNKIIECALEANTDYIVTGDKHLLEIGQSEEIKILTPADFLSFFKARA